LGTGFSAGSVRLKSRSESMLRRIGSIQLQPQALFTTTHSAESYERCDGTERPHT
jgi:hypothetical protein